MKRSSLEIYSLAVCFLAVIAIVISLSISIYNVIEISFPEFAIDQWQFEQHSSNDKFWENHPKHFPQEKNGNPAVRPPEEQLTKMRSESYKVVVKNQIRRSTQSLVGAIIVLLLSVILLFFHWKLFVKSQKE